MAKKKSNKSNNNNNAKPQSVEPPVLSGVVVGSDQDVVDTSTTTPNTTDGNGFEDDDGAEEEMELLQVDLGDMIKMKQVLDEGVSAALLDHVPEDCRWDNVKLLLMFLSCVFAMTAQFAPIPFPESRVVLGICGSLYFVLSGILQFITTFIDQDMILLTKPLSTDDDESSPSTTTTKDSKKTGNSSSSSKKTNSLLFRYGLRVRSNFPRFSEFYTINLEFRFPKKDPLFSSLQAKSVKAVWSVGKFFDKEGYFDEVGLSNEITKLYNRLEAEDYNGMDDDKTSKKKTE